MPRKPVTFLNTEYKTQGEFEKYVKKIIYEDIGICNDVKNAYPDKYNILIKILERHPDFNSKTENMCNIKIMYDTLNKKALKILIVKNDGNNDDISWRCAITAKHKSKKHELMSAMRSSIDSQIKQFKKAHYNDGCQICDNNERLDVDHNDIKNSAFDELVLNFIKKNNDIEIPDKFGELNDDTHRRRFLEKDTDFKDKWLKYHNEHASLRMLCHTCNISRPKTKNKFVL
jgi:hypothetical protein